MTTLNKNNALFIQIEPSRCQGHNRCYTIAPELFDVDEYGLVRLLSDQAIPADLVEKASLAMQNCPEFAITLTENCGVSENE